MPKQDRWIFDFCAKHNGEYYYTCDICGETDWIASYGTKDQLKCKCTGKEKTICPK